MRRGVAELGLAEPLDDRANADPPADDGQIRRQRAVALEGAQNFVIVVNDLQKDVGGDVLDVGLGQRDAPRMGDVVDHVVDQAHVAVDEIIPGFGLVGQATVEQLAIDLAERHGRTSSSRLGMGCLRLTIGFRRGTNPISLFYPTDDREQASPSKIASNHAMNRPVGGGEGHLLGAMVGSGSIRVGADDLAVAPGSEGPPGPLVD